ncbi:cache domain-containing protein [Candidatus Marithioploca araucensis]|uniref:Cache domain-containing protein n=1 Tax=Candidatus Marithioploca araucensis TaxID=70273 RepID=A0ABT7VRJ5_9GAMM|nr:cache domain-containing protein [Candidatus Marithioploca araucensis]
MKKNRIMFAVLIPVILGYGIYLWRTVSIIQKKGTEDIRKYQEMAIANVKQNLKNNVDIAYAMIESNHNNSLYETPAGKTYFENFYGPRLENIIVLVEVILKSKAKQVDDGKLSLEKAQEQAKVEIKQLRYDNGRGYIWINDTGKPYPKMIMHPTLPSLDGKILDDPSFNTALGGKKNLFVAFVEVCENKGEGYINYYWPKPLPDGLTHDKPKLSYVILFEEWNWIIGTGVYIDDAIEDGKTKSIYDLKQMRYGVNRVGYFWINDTTKPTPKMIMHPTKPELDGTILDDEKYNTTLGKYTDVQKGQNLFEAFAEVCETQGSGYVDYEWPKPTGNELTKPQPKMSYVKLYEPLDWIVGSGAYIDDIENEIKKREKAIKKQTMSLIEELAISVIIIILTMVILYFVLKKYLPNQK